MYVVSYTRQAVRQLRRMPQRMSDRIRRKVMQIAQDPYARHNNVRPLVGRPGFRLRVGDWRVLYAIENDELRILVLDVARQDEVYR